MVLGGSLVAGERVVVEDDHELSRHCTEPRLQTFAFFRNLLSFICVVRVVKGGRAEAGELGPDSVE